MRSEPDRMEVLLETVTSKIAKEMPAYDPYDQACAANYAFIAIEEVLSSMEESLRFREKKCRQHSNDHKEPDLIVDWLLMSEGWEYAADEVSEIIADVVKHKENMMRVWKK